jgi:hypothetical protein
MAKRNYDNNYLSVTQVLDVLRKPGLEMWFKLNTIKEIKTQSAKGKEIGTQIHEAIHRYIETGETKVETAYAEEVGNALRSFMLFRKENPGIVLKNAEIAMTSESLQVNGTLDCLSEGVLLDWKTGQAKEKDKPAIYDEAKYQVAAYVFLYNEIFDAKIRKAVIVAVAKDKVAYNLYAMEWDEIKACFNEVFLPSLRIATYQRRGKNGLQYANGGRKTAEAEKVTA